MSARERLNEGPLPDPLAFLITWTTYGTWLPGDERGWIEYHRGWQLPDPVRKREAEARMAEDACVLHPQERAVVEATIAEHCAKRGWTLHAVNCRTNHVHVVVSGKRHPKQIRSQLKAWCTRRLKEFAEQVAPGTERALRENWWAERGSGRYINDEPGLEAAILYVRDGQDRPR